MRSRHQDAHPGPKVVRLASPIVPADLIVASNRGPVSFVRDGDSLVGRRGGGGMISGMVSALAGSDALWVCAALSEADREAVRTGIEVTDPVRVRMLEIDDKVFHGAYNDIANSVLWFVNHLLYATPTAPVFDAAFRSDWGCYVAYNRAFADAVADAAAPGAKVVVQDYHLFLVPAMLRDARPDLRIGHFTHTPWAPPEYFALLPDDIRVAVLTGVLGADHAGFLSSRWADAFQACAAEFLGASWSDGGASFGGRLTSVGVHGLGSDRADLEAIAHSEQVDRLVGELRSEARECRVILRVDRTELSKNIVRGLLAYRELLRAHPEWVGNVVHLVFAYPSRQDLAEYRDYTESVTRLVEEIGTEFATADWHPVHLSVRDDFERSLAAMRIADVLVVNPIRDGMNLVAKEGPLLSDDGLVLVLSREAGAADELGADALLLNPYDVSQTAELLHEALVMDPGERSARCERLAAAATALPPQQWFADQIAALG
jgi:trehalose 6-phosphate synthase